jgi:hypothetical protein
MPDPFDPYREALVIETNTIWPDEVGKLVPDAAERQRLDERLHAAPAQAGQLDYVRLFTGFCRQITVTQSDLDRLRCR